jgi:hypothetical protein
MKRFLLGFALLASSWAIAQTCLVPAPPAPPIPALLVVKLPVDGGTAGCTVKAFAPGGGGDATAYAISNAKCAQSVAIARQAAANDNGWNDGGTP